MDPGVLLNRYQRCGDQLREEAVEDQQVGDSGERVPQVAALSEHLGEQAQQSLEGSVEALGGDAQPPQPSPSVEAPDEESDGDERNRESPWTG